MIKHKFVFGLASLGLILLSAGVTYFVLSAVIYKAVPWAKDATQKECDSGPLAGHLQIVFSADIPPQMQDKVLASNKAVLDSRDYQKKTNTYNISAIVETGMEAQVAESLKVTPGVQSAQQTVVVCAE